MSYFKEGESAYLAREIIEPATGDHPAFLMGERGEKVEILKYCDDGFYLVEGLSNPGLPWYARTEDLMRTKPWSIN